MSKTLFITSCLDTNEKIITSAGEKIRIPHNFGNENNILTNLKKYITKYENMLIIASDEFNSETTDSYAKIIIESFNKTLPFSCYQILDHRTEKDAKNLVRDADFIFIMGGHVPTQNKFFKNINLLSLLDEYDGVILGGSAGSMNMARTVYCPPELDGEGRDKNFKRFLDGLDLTNINIFPHYSIVKDDILDGKNMFDYAKEDSIKLPILVLEDGSYCIEKDNKITLFGVAYKLQNKKLSQICENGKQVEINHKLDTLSSLQIITKKKIYNKKDKK